LASEEVKNLAVLVDAHGRGTMRRTYNGLLGPGTFLEVCGVVV